MRIRTIALTAALTLVGAAPALAADHNATLSAASPSFAWDGGPGNGFAVSTPVGGLSGQSTPLACNDDVATCDEILLKLDVGGTLTVAVNADDDSTDAIDVYLWPSNEAGEYDDGEDDLAAAEGATEASDESITLQLEPGYYMARVEFYDALEDTYKGSAVLSGFPVAQQEQQQQTAPPPPPPQQQPGSQQPPPQQQSQPAEPARNESSAAKRRKACQKKAKKIKNKRKRKKALKRCRRIR